jgi:hypothetical protein
MVHSIMVALAVAFIAQLGIVLIVCAVEVVVLARDRASRRKRRWTRELPDHLPVGVR